MGPQHALGFTNGPGKYPASASNCIVGAWRTPWMSGRQKAANMREKLEHDFCVQTSSWRMPGCLGGSPAASMREHLERDFCVQNSSDREGSFVQCESPSARPTNVLECCRR